MEGKRMIRLFAVGLTLAVVSLVGASPVLAQDGSEPDAESAAGATAADELLAKVVEQVRSVLEDEAPHPMMRVESDLRIAYDGNAQWDMPDFNWEFVSMIDSDGDSSTVVTLSADGWEPSTDRERLVADLLDNYHMRIVIGDTAYYSLGISGKLVEAFGFVGGDVCTDLFGSWVAEDQPVIEDRSQNQQQVLQKILDGRLEFTSLYYLVSLGDDMLIELLDDSESPEIIEQDVINGHDVSRIRLKIAEGLLAFGFVPYLDTMMATLVIALENTDMPRTIPQSLLNFVLDTSPDYSYDIWVDDDGRVHRIHADLSFALGGYLDDFATESGFVSDAFEKTFTAEVTYIEENPAIEQPAADQVIVVSGDGLSPADFTEAQHLQCLAKLAEFNAGQSSEGDSQPSEGGGGEELPSTGVNTPLLAIIGLSAMAAGLMVFSLSRRLRSSASL